MKVMPSRRVASSPLCRDPQRTTPVVSREQHAAQMRNGLASDHGRGLQTFRQHPRHSHISTILFYSSTQKALDNSKVQANLAVQHCQMQQETVRLKTLHDCPVALDAKSPISYAPSSEERKHVFADSINRTRFPHSSAFSTAHSHFSFCPLEPWRPPLRVILQGYPRGNELDRGSHHRRGRGHESLSRRRQ